MTNNVLLSWFINNFETWVFTTVPDEISFIVLMKSLICCNELHKFVWIRWRIGGIVDLIT